MSDTPIPEIQPNLDSITALELWSLLKQTGVLHNQILRGLLPLTRMQALHLAGATDYDWIKAELKTALAEVEAAQAEAERLRRFEAYQNNRLVQARQDSQVSLAHLGYKPGELIVKWRWTAYPPGSGMPNYAQELYAVVIDALTQEGVTAWPGDGVGIVTQFIDTQVKAREKAQAEAEQLRAERDQARGGNPFWDMARNALADNDRLREAVTMNADAVQQLAHESAMLRAEAARLREALVLSLDWCDTEDSEGGAAFARIVQRLLATSETDSTTNETLTKVATLSAENARLREALAEIINCTKENDCPEDVYQIASIAMQQNEIPTPMAI